MVALLEEAMESSQGTVSREEGRRVHSRTTEEMAGLAEQALSMVERLGQR
jgi:hypothetical protein